MQTPRIIPAARISRQMGAPSGRRFATAITAAAAALALVLAVALPARAGAEGASEGGFVPKAELVYMKKKPKHGKGVVPSVCAIEFEGERRNVTIYPESCLLDAGLSRKLPYRCGKDARIFGQWDVVFSERCLAEAGFILPGGHGGPGYND